MVIFTKPIESFIWNCNTTLNTLIGLFMWINLLSLGLIVQNGKFSAGTWLLVRILKNVDFLNYIRRNFKATNPTFGRPTTPHLRLVPILPSKTAFFGKSPFFLDIGMRVKWAPKPSRPARSRSNCPPICSSESRMSNVLILAIYSA